MNPVMITLFADGLLAALLVITIVYCFRLQRRIAVIQGSKGELARLLKLFDECTERASRSIAELQTVSKKVAETVTVRMDKANLIADDLHFLIDRASKLADTMEGNITVMRNNHKVISELEKYNARPFTKVEPQPSYTPKPSGEAVLAAKMDIAATQHKTTSSIEAILEKLSARPAAAAPANTNIRMRTRAEDELADMLKRNL